MAGVPLELLKKVRWVEFHFTDLAGILRAVMVPSREVDEKALEKGLSLLDGSSVEGFAGIEESDYKLRPDMSTFALLPWKENAARVIADVLRGDERFVKDPRYVAERAENYLAEQGMVAYFGPEVEFMLIDSLVLDVETPYRGLGYRVLSRELPEDEVNIGFQKVKKAYHTPTPIDMVAQIRYEIAETLEDYFGFQVEAHHHEVAAIGQIER